MPDCRHGMLHATWQHACVPPMRLLSSHSLPAVPLVTPAQALLRYALPIDCKPIRQVQRDLEGISDDLRVPGKGVCCGGH